MTQWSLATVLASLHDDIQHRLRTVRSAIAHPVGKGDGTETVWLDLLNRYLPERYRAARAYVVDSQGRFSDQIDVVVFDRQYTPFIFSMEGQEIVPAESVYGVFECKQTIDAGIIAYAQGKAASVRRLHRTSLPIPHAGGVYPAKPSIRIVSGVLSFESQWTPPLGKSLVAALEADAGEGVLDLGCVASHGYFRRAGTTYETVHQDKPATAFLFELIAMLQASGTVPMIDVGAYARWLASPPEFPAHQPTDKES